MFESQAEYYAIDGRKVTRKVFIQQLITLLAYSGMVMGVLGYTGKLSFIFYYIITNGIVGLMSLTLGTVSRKEEVKLIGMVTIIISVLLVLALNLYTSFSFIKVIIWSI